MPIPERTLSKWSHHEAGTAFKQAHVPIREAMASYNWPSDLKYQVFLQGSYKNDTNLGGDSDVDVVVRLTQRLRPRVADLTGQRLQEDASHQGAHQRWQSFRDHALKAMRSRYGKAVKSGRKTLKIPKGKIPADADLVVTLSYKGGIAFYTLRRETLGRELSAAAPRPGAEEGRGRQQPVQEDHPHVQGGPEPAGQQASAHQRRCSLLLHRVPALQRSRRPIRTEAGADLYRHPRLASDGEPQGLRVPERAGAPVRAGAGTVDPEKSAGVRQGDAGALGGRGLRVEVRLA